MNLSELTEEQARTIEAGVECDILVSQACGKMGSFVPRHVGEECNSWKVKGKFWHPSTDANVAIEAARKFLPVEVAIETGICTANIFNKVECGASAETLALAICRAILVRAVRLRTPIP